MIGFNMTDPVYQRFDDERGGGGGGSGTVGFAKASFDLELRLSSIMAEKLKTAPSAPWLLVLLFVQSSAEVFKAQIKPKLDYWHHRSGDRFDLVCIGYSDKVGESDPELFSGSVRWLQERSGWKYSGEADLVLMNVTVSPDGSSINLHTDQVVCVDVEHAVKEGAIRSLSGLMERVATFVENYKGTDPTWGFSDAEGRKLVTSSLKSILLACLPKSMRKEARAAFHFHVRECQKD